MKQDIFREMKEKSGGVDIVIEELIPRDFGDLMERDFGGLRWGCDDRALTGAIAKPMWDLLDRGGKRWRPFLMKLCFEAVRHESRAEGVDESRVNIEEFFPIVEVIHNGTLMVDDIEDGSSLRRGSPCVHKIYGDDIAINAGNAMYYLPMLSVMKSDLDAETKVRIYDVVNEEMIKLSFGQGMDIFWHRGNGIPSEGEYLQMCAFKTGTLARMSAKLGSILGGADDRVIKALGEFAEAIGVAFQIQDDILNICPGKDWGKDFGDDISEGKRTLILIRAIGVESSGISEEDKKDLIGILDLKTNNKVMIGEAIGILRNSGAIEYADGVARDLVREAWEKLDGILDPSDAKDKLKVFSEYVVGREL
jgi:geranylgeranyl pyrophosphate synthase